MSVKKKRNKMHNNRAILFCHENRFQCCLIIEHFVKILIPSILKELRKKYIFAETISSNRVVRRKIIPLSKIADFYTGFRDPLACGLPISINIHKLWLFWRMYIYPYNNFLFFFLSYSSINVSEKLHVIFLIYRCGKRSLVFSSSIPYFHCVVTRAKK